jgi:hypothetical protein
LLEHDDDSCYDYVAVQHNLDYVAVQHANRNRLKRVQAPARFALRAGIDTDSDPDPDFRCIGPNRTQNRQLYGLTRNLVATYAALLEAM